MGELLNQGYFPKDISFCTFSRSASKEIKQRIAENFNLNKKDIPYFGTIHSLCYREFSLDKKVLGAKEKEKFFSTTKIDYNPIDFNQEFLSGDSFLDDDGNILMGFYDKLRLTYCKNIYSIKEKELKKLFFELPSLEENYKQIFVNSFNPYKILKDYEDFKKEKGLVDFVDMLLMAYNSNYNLPVKILVVDEFQDLSPLQYEIYKKWSKGKKEVYIAGDPQQTIYSFLCASPEFFYNELDSLDKKKGDEEITLKKTYRMHSKINEFCQNYIKNMKGRKKYSKIEPFKIGGEIVKEYIDEDLGSVLDYLREDKYTFILFRTNYYKNLFTERVLIPKGIVYDEIKSQGIWNNRTINLFNAVQKLIKKKPLNIIEVNYLIKNIPFKLGLLKRGLKSNFKDMEKKDEYMISDLLKLGFDMKLFKMLSYGKLFSILDITDKIKQTFLNAKKQIVSFPILLKVGTIHSSKGMEANDVILFKDVSGRISKKLGFGKKEDNWDEEIRLFYVGQSRCRERLVILRGGFKNSDMEIIP